MAKAVRVLPIVRPAPKLTTLADNIASSGQRFATGSYSWYNQLIQSAHQRLIRYNDYDLMNEDGDVSRALDMIADEIAGTIDSGVEHQLQIEVLDDEMSSQTLEVLQMALRIWIESSGIHGKVFEIARNMIMYGDCFFIKAHPNAKWAHMSPRNMIDCVVDQMDGTTPLGWNIRADGNAVVLRLAGSDVVSTAGPGSGKDQQLAQIPANQVVRFTMCDNMSVMAPYGESILRPAVRTFKQKQLIEDAVIIYRVQRAPERRVFYMDVGSAPLPMRAQLMEQMKNEIKQKKVPRPNNSGDPNANYDKVYDPLTTNEDYFFPIGGDSRGSRVETLPGGSNTGEVADLDVWRRAMWRALKVPYSYLEDGSDSNGGTYNDGKVGVAYIQELNFNRMVQRHQTQLNIVFDREFKIYLKHNGIVIDNDRFKVRLPTPQNFSAYRQQEVDSGLLQNYSSVESVPYISKRFALERFMRLTKDEIIANERSMKQELGLDPDDETIPAHLLYIEEYRQAVIDSMSARIAPVPPELTDEDMGMGDDDGFDDGNMDGPGGGGGGFSGGEFDGDDMGGDDMGGEGGEDTGDDMGGSDEPSGGMDDMPPPGKNDSLPNP